MDWRMQSVFRGQPEQAQELSLQRRISSARWTWTFGLNGSERYAGAAALHGVSRVARAQGYPARPVRVIVGFAPGQAIDIAMRIIAQRLSERLGQQVFIENRPGGGGNIATEAVVRSPPDGYTLLAIGSNNMINATLYPKLAYDFSREIAPVASVYRVPQVMEVNPSFPAKTVPEFIAYAKARPGRNQFCLGGQWLGRACDRRVVQNADRREHAACALSGSATGTDRSHCGTGACHVRQYALLHRAHQGRQAAPFGRDRYDTPRGASGRAAPWRFRAGI